MTRDELVERMARALARHSRANCTDTPTDAVFAEYESAEWHLFADEAAAALTELEKHAVVVPAEATDSMKAEVACTLDDPDPFGFAGEIYRAMLAARPR